MINIITSSQLLAVSGGCQKAVDKYEGSAGFYEFVGTLSGLAIGVAMVSPQATVSKILAGFAGAYIGAEAGYVFGATSYWVNRAIHKTTDSLLKPAL